LTEAQLVGRRERKIENFKNQFKDRSLKEITEISQSEIFDKDAVEAAKSLLKEKGMG